MGDSVINEIMSLLLVEDKRSDFFEKYKQLPLEFKPEDGEDIRKAFFETLWAADTSTNKKYIPWFFKVIEKEGRSVSPIGLDYTLGQVSRQMDYIEKKVNKYAIEQWKNRLENGDLKYFSLLYDKIAKAPKDINSYPNITSIREFYRHISDLNYTKEQEQQAKKESQKLYEDSNYLIVKPLSHAASCVYGRETKWCVAMKDNPRYFDDYIRNSTFVYVINKKGKDSRYSKFALRIPQEKGKSIEVWDQADNKSTLDVMYENMPGIQEIITNVLNIATSDYAILKAYKEKKLDEKTAFLNSPNFELIGDFLFIYFEDIDEYFETVFKYSLHQYTIKSIISLFSRYHSMDFYDSYTSDEEVREGYAFYDLSDEGKILLDKIIKLISPQLYSKKVSLDQRDYYQEVGMVISANQKLFDNLSQIHAEAMSSAYDTGLKNAAVEEYVDILSNFGITKVKDFKTYKTTVDNMMELIEKFGSLPGYSIFKILGIAVDTLGVPDIIEDSYEYKDDDEYISLWQDQSTRELDKFYDELVDELDGEFDDMDKYREVVDFVIKHFGFNVRKEIPVQPGTYFSILGVEPDSNIKIKVDRGTNRRFSIISLEQLETLLKNYKLFDIV